MALDTQQIELVGRTALETELIKRGFEVARPHRDKGIDLLVFLDEPTKPFVALPIQMKAYTGTTFGVWRKYERMKGLVLVYIWNVRIEPRFFMMTYSEAVRLIPAARKRTSSWNKPLAKGGVELDKGTAAHRQTNCAIRKSVGLVTKSAKRGTGTTLMRHGPPENAQLFEITNEKRFAHGPRNPIPSNLKKIVESFVRTP